jgi:hypothetical protein
MPTHHRNNNQCRCEQRSKGKILVCVLGACDASYAANVLSVVWPPCRRALLFHPLAAAGPRLLPPLPPAVSTTRTRALSTADRRADRLLGKGSQHTPPARHAANGRCRRCCRHSAPSSVSSRDRTRAATTPRPTFRGGFRPPPVPAAQRACHSHCTGRSAPRAADDYRRMVGQENSQPAPLRPAIALCRHTYGATPRPPSVLPPRCHGDGKKKIFDLGSL